MQEKIFPVFEIKMCMVTSCVGVVGSEPHYYILKGDVNSLFMHKVL